MSSHPWPNAHTLKLNLLIFQQKICQTQTSWTSPFLISLPLTTLNGLKNHLKVGKLSDTILDDVVNESHKTNTILDDVTNESYKTKALIFI